MSSIATFHKIPSDKEASLLAASEVVRNTTVTGFLFFKKENVEVVDGLWSFLEEFGHEQHSFEFSGHTFVSLEILLADNGVTLYQYEKQPASDVFRNTRAEHGSIFDASGATQTLAALRSVNLTTPVIEEFMRQEHPEDDLEFGVEAVEAAADILEQWLETVQENEIGLFMF